MAFRSALTSNDVSCPAISRTVTSLLFRMEIVNERCGNVGLLRWEKDCTARPGQCGDNFLRRGTSRRYWCITTCRPRLQLFAMPTHVSSSFGYKNLKISCVEGWKRSAGATRYMSG